MLRIGSHGADVKVAQQLLNVAQGAGLAVDGIFGPKTDTATRQFQRSRQLPPDGVIGEHTWTALRGAERVNPPLPDQPPPLPDQPPPIDVKGPPPLLPDDQLPSKTRDGIKPTDCDKLIGEIFFRTDESNLDQLSDSRELRQLVDQLRQLMEQGHVPHLVATGFADPRHTDEHNQPLSLRRAEAVRDYIESELEMSGIVDVEGAGECFLVQETADPIGLAKCRRVDIIDLNLCKKPEEKEEKEDDGKDIPGCTTKIGGSRFLFTINGGVQLQIKTPEIPKTYKDLLPIDVSATPLMYILSVTFQDLDNSVAQTFDVKAFGLGGSLSFPKGIPKVKVIPPMGPVLIERTKPMTFCQIPPAFTNILSPSFFGFGGFGIEFLGPTPRVTVGFRSTTFKLNLSLAGAFGGADPAGDQFATGSGSCRHEC